MEMGGEIFKNLQSGATMLFDVKQYTYYGTGRDS